MYACTLPLVAGPASESRVIDGHIQNISCTGLCLLARQRLKISELLVGEIGFPGTRASVPTLLQVRWLRKNSFGARYRAGLHFVVQAGIVAALRAGQNRPGCGKDARLASLEIAARFPLSHSHDDELRLHSQCLDGIAQSNILKWLDKGATVSLQPSANPVRISRGQSDEGRISRHCSATAPATGPLSLPLPLFNAWPLRPAHGFNLYGWVFESAEFLNVRADLQHGVRDIIRILLRTEKYVVGQPNGLFVGRTLGYGAVETGFQIEGRLAAPTERRPFCRIDGKERALIYGLVKEAVAGNAFHLQRAQERGARNAAEIFGEVLEDELVCRHASLAFVGGEESEARCPAQPFGEVLHIGLADLGLFGQTLKLRRQDHGLQFS